METKKVTIEIPKRANAEDVKALVKKLFAFDVTRYYGSSKGFPLVRLKWKLSA
jgi:hypothetical protein